MRFARNSTPLAAGAVLLILLSAGLAQQKREDFQATAYGTSTQLGRTFSVNITIESYSTPEDQQKLLEAFAKGGNEGLVEALDKMPIRGRISMPGFLGYEIRYARVWPAPGGRRIRVVTDRPLAIGEVRRSTRSRDYSVSAAELELNDDLSKSTGTLIPACQLKLNKQNEIELEAFQNPWRLDNFLDWKK